MKTGNVIIAIVLIVLCVVGWLTFGSQVLGDASSRNNYIAQGDAWLEDGLYQRAIGQYELAMGEDAEEPLYIKIHTAYSLRYAEAPEETLDDYMDFLQNAVDAFPGNGTFVDSYVDIYFEEHEYEEVYACLKKAIANGYNTQSVQTKILQVRYLFEESRTSYYKLIQSEGAMYSATRKDGQMAYSVENGNILTHTYSYVGLPSAEGVAVVTGADSRIIDSTGLVMGIFEKPVTEAGVYAEGLVPACVDGVYSYYDEFAIKQFGEYAFAGKFQNDVAAVKKDNKWMLVDKTGTVVTDSLGEIVTDYSGGYMADGKILAKTAANTYTIYDEKYNALATFQAAQTDVCTEDGLIAFSQNDKWGFVNTNGEVVINPQYQQAKSFSNGIAAVCKDGLWGFVNTENVLVIDYQFYHVGYMDDTGSCAVCVEIPKTEEEAGEGAQKLEVQEKWKLIALELGILEDE